VTRSRPDTAPIGTAVVLTARWRRTVVALGACAAVGCAAAQTATSATPADRWTYTLGAKVSAGDLSQLDGSVRARPILGLRYGRWRLGVGDGREWLRFNANRNNSGLSFEAKDTDRWHVSYSAQLRHTHTDSDYQLGNSGPITLRARLAIDWALTPQTGVNFTWGQDALGRGDGASLGLGVTRAWAFSPSSEWRLNAGATWGSAQRWHIPDSPNTWALGSGWGDMGVSAHYRRALGTHTAWYATLGLSRPLAQRAKALGERAVLSAQVGYLVFNY
jgi:hypothetical protein